ncbi:acetylglutamate kinase [Marinococcus halophilus]|uniref:acetylglutamate kinase n=1 Tax=Marinococcus halophilus TaxID=1371 RepID=UPI003CC815D5
MSVENITVVKCGGSTVNKLTAEFFKSIAAMRETGMNPILVHGGGPEINRMLEQMQIECEFVNGLRKTTPEVLEVAEMILSGKVNKALVSSLQTTGTRAFGMSGVDGGLIEAEQVADQDLGLVGEVVNVNTACIKSMIENGFVPVIAPIAADKNGKKLNVNADAAASAVAQAIGAKELLFITDVEGVLIDGSKADYIQVEKLEQLIYDGEIYGGMIPKVQAAAASLTGDLEKVVIAGADGHTDQANGKLKGTAIIREQVQALT